MCLMISYMARFIGHSHLGPWPGHLTMGDWTAQKHETCNLGGSRHRFRTFARMLPPSPGFLQAAVGRVRQRLSGACNPAVTSSQHDGSKGPQLA